MHTLTLDRSLPRDFALVLLASFVISLSGQIAIPLWFTPIPIATRNFVILLSAVLLGSRRGSAAVFAFLVQGALGWPVFSNGLSGIGVFFGPQGGYLIGYLVAAFITGYIAEQKKSPVAALTLGNLIIYLCGATYLATFVGISQAILLGIAPFILGDLLKMGLSLKFLQWMKR